MSTNLDPFFNPQSIAVVGASADPTRLSGRPLRYLRELGYSGRVYPVNPNRSVVQNLRAYPTVEDLPEPVDMALVVVPPSATLQVIAQCVVRGVKTAVVMSAGYAEVGAEGERLQEELATLAHAGGLRILGPNCLGVMSGPQRLMATFAVGFESGFPKLGPVALVTQSGALGSYVLSLARQTGVPVSYWIATGNEVDVDVADAVTHFAASNDVEVISVYLEGTKHGDHFATALKAAREAGKCVVVLKGGRTDVGRRAVSTHTAALVGDDDLYSALFTREGVHRAETLREFIDVTEALVRLRRLPTTRRAAVLTSSGGVGILMADQLRAAGMEVPPPSPNTADRLHALMPSAATSNPFDVTAQLTNQPELLGQFLRVLVQEDYDQILVFLGSRGLRMDIAGHVATIREVLGDGPAPIILASTLLTPETRAQFQEAGIPVFEDPSQAIAVANALALMGEKTKRERDRNPVPSPVGERLTPLSGVLGEADLAPALMHVGVPWVPFERVRSASEASAAVQRLGGTPVIVKGVSPGVVHKTEAGLVVPNVGDPKDAASAYTRLEQVAEERGSPWSGALVETMVQGYEMVVAVRRDPVFGPTVSVGWGGVFVEAIADIVVRLAPLTEVEAHDMIRRLRGGEILQGLRGKPAADLNSLCRLMVRLSRLAFEYPDLEELELNPVIVGPVGQGVYAADALGRVCGTTA